MKKLISFFISTSLIIGLASCGGDKKEEIKAPEGMRVVDLSKYGKVFTIFTPDSTQGKLEIIEQPGGILQVKVGKIFDINIKEGAEDLAFKKADLGNDDVYKIKQFFVDEPTTIAWEWAIGDMPSEFHFISVQKVGNSTYTFEDNRNSDGAPFSKSAIEKMIESVKNIHPINKNKE